MFRDYIYFRTTFYAYHDTLNKQGTEIAFHELMNLCINSGIGSGMYKDNKGGTPKNRQSEWENVKWKSKKE